MSEKKSRSNRLLLPGRLVLLAVVGATIVLSGKISALVEPYGLIFVLLGAAGMALTSYSTGEIGAAFSHAAVIPESRLDIMKSALFWESAARNFWILGVLYSILNFAVTLGNLLGSLGSLASGLATSLLAALYGLVLATVCGVPYWRLAAHFDAGRDDACVGGDTAARRGETRPSSFTRTAGYLVIGAALLSAFMQSAPGGVWAAVNWTVYWPSLLIVWGGALALILFIGNVPGCSPALAGFALAGLIGSLMGFIQTLLGFAAKNIGDISSALTFVLSSCVAALLGMILVGAPLEDRSAWADGRGGRRTVGRLASAIFPLVALIFLVVIFILVVTPMQVDGGSSKP
ncbi:MAG: hypothetical protein FJW35_00940 [Acidobacteria bacterium]|nr:hypothetical protein [Acidobacteriota bacterium]